MQNFKLMSVVGARPNFMKVSPFVKAIIKFNKTNKLIEIDHKLVHTGQHYDHQMSNSFFETLMIPKPNFNLGIGSGTHAEQIGNTLIEFEKLVKQENPDWIIVIGDVNATIACSIVARKEGVNLCHIEAGLRSFDMNMPEEINRVVTDRISNLLLTPDKISSQNLINEGLDKGKIKLVGNIMIDTLLDQKRKAHKISKIAIVKNNRFDYQEDKYHNLDKFGLITLHRPSNVDNKNDLEKLINLFINKISAKIFLIWPLHPRTLENLKKYNLLNRLISAQKIFLLDPISYREMLKLNTDAAITFTDSGGVQEECCVLGTPCLTLRESTERPVTLKENGGASFLVGKNEKKIEKYFNQILNGKIKILPFYPKMWDGLAAERCLDALINYENDLN